MVKVIGYTRVSTQGQVADGISLEAQKEKIRAYCQVNDAELVEFFTDEGISGTKGDRPGLLAALEAVKENQAALVVYSLSRLSRSTADTLAIAERLDKAGADLVSLSEKIDTTTAAGKMVFRMLAVLTEFERDQVSDRTKAALAYKRSQEEYTGGHCPYGFQVDETGRLHPDHAESKAVDRILELRGQGQSYSAIAKQLNDLGYKTKTGRCWYPQTIKNVITARAA